MKVKFHLDIGLIGGQREEIIDIPDDDLEGMDENDIDEAMYDVYLPEWVDQHIHYSWRKV